VDLVRHITCRETGEGTNVLRIQLIDRHHTHHDMMTRGSRLVSSRGMMSSATSVKGCWRTLGRGAVVHLGAQAWLRSAGQPSAVMPHGPRTGAT
jgi:hypothetical protein